MPIQRQPVSSRTILTIVMAALALWAVYIAVGAYWYNFNPWRAVVVLGCMAAFLGFWLLMLWARARRSQR
jgi:ABC-type transport system involved in Fe-S cluster assembly fused permease/ATPase subunit